MIKKLKKKSNGITLIALVITIIVLLILAGISIATLTGENSVIVRAKNAKEATRAGTIKDYIELQVANNFSSNYTGEPKKNKTDLINELLSNGYLTPEEIARLENDDEITIVGIKVDFSLLNFDGNTYEIAYVLNGGTNNPSNPSTYVSGETVKLYSPTKQASLFLGWTEDAQFNEKINNNEEVKYISEVPVNSVGNKTLYAVWKDAFYVYHSGVAGGNIETFGMPEEGIFNLLSTNITNGTFYGGYYLEGGFKDVETETINGQEVYSSYNGDNWTWIQPQVVSGVSIVPQVGTTYYIKEVPNNKFLQINPVKSFGGGKITGMHVFANVDDYYYNEYGFVVNSNITSQGTLYSSFSLKTGSVTNVYTAANLFETYGSTSADYIVCLNDKENAINENVQQVEYVAYLITPDNIKVTGTTKVQLVYGDHQESSLEVNTEIIEGTSNPK